MPATSRRAGLLGLVVGTAVMAACGDDGGLGDGPGPTGSTTIAAPAVTDCVVWLHGRGGHGGPVEVRDGVTVLSPAGNAEWQDGGRQWLYAEPADLAAATTIVTDAVDGAGCARVVVHGFSNGGAFAAKLYCGGGDLGGRLRGVVIDDPVTDASAVDCSPAAGVEGALYWTTALEGWAPAGTPCADVGWTCEGPTVIGVAAYAAALGLPVTASVHTDHVPYADPPDIARWLAGG